MKCENATFRPASTGLDHALGAWDLTQILVEGSGCRLFDPDPYIFGYMPPKYDQGPVEAGRNVRFVSHISLQSKFNLHYDFYSWSHEQYMVSYN